jgi:hypothetical protein
MISPTDREVSSKRGSGSCERGAEPQINISGALRKPPSAFHRSWAGDVGKIQDGLFQQRIRRRHSYISPICRCTLRCRAFGSFQASTNTAWRGLIKQPVVGSDSSSSGFARGYRRQCRCDASRAAARAHPANARSLACRRVIIHLRTHVHLLADE